MDAMIALDDALQTLIHKLTHCQDSKTLEQIFIGAIKVQVRADGVAVLCVEETTWETPSGDLINTTWYANEKACTQ
jgi:hypothetical protein